MDSTDAPRRRDDDARAGRQLDAALRAVGSRFLHVVETSSAAAVLIHGKRTSEAHLGPWTVPLAVVPDEARALEGALAEFGINVTVTVEEFERWEEDDTTAFRLDFPTAEDVASFAAQLIAHLPEPAATAHRLRAALGKAGIEQWVGFENSRIWLESLDAVHAAVLCDLLGHRVGETIQQDLATADWHLMEQIAVEISAALSTVLGEEIKVSSNPVCRTCACSRDNEMDVVSLSAQAAQRLARALEAANTPTDGPPGPFEGAEAVTATRAHIPNEESSCPSR